MDGFSLTSRLLPAFIPPAAWEALPTFKNTVIEVETDVGGGNLKVLMPETLRAREELMFARMARGEPDPEPTGPVRERRVVFCHYLASLVNKADPDDADCAAFGKVITNLLEEKLLLGKLMEPCYIRLATRWPTGVDVEGEPIFEERPPRCMLLAYVFADMTREQLNAKVGFEAFQEEGALPRDEWGSHVMQQICPPRTK